MDDTRRKSLKGTGKHKSTKMSEPDVSRSPHHLSTEAPDLPVEAPDPPAALMHPDILTLIFEHFDLQAGSKTTAQTRKDLFSAAKTCKAFVEPALNSLWRVLPSLLPLLLLLPSAEVRGDHYFVDRLPLSQSWERFDIHALRVRTLYMERLRIVISPHVYLLIRSIRSTPLLPGLKEIYIPDSDNTPLDFSSAILLASVRESALNLVRLDNSAISDRQFCTSILFLLSVNSPNLAHLALCGTEETSLELIPHFRSLQSLELRLSGTRLGSQMLQNLGKLDNLLYMTLDTSLFTQYPTKRHDYPHLTPPANYSTFIKLRRLHILGSPRSMSCVLNEMDVLTNLTTLIIHETINSGSNTESSWRQCFTTISTFPAIEGVEITQLHDVPSWSPHYTLSTLCLSPLYKLDNLTSFVINNSTLSGSDNDFRLLAYAFPKLKKFVEPCAQYPQYSQGKTLASLLYFSQANPDLREIKISLASNISGNLEAINVIGHPIIQNHQHPLEKLYVASRFGSLDLSDMIKVAQFLDLIFPNLSTLEAYDSMNPYTQATGDVSDWTKIQQIRVALQAARINGSKSAMNMANRESFR